MLHRLYSGLPVFLQHASATAVGACYNRLRYGGVFQAYLGNLKRTEYLSASQLRAMQSEALERLHRHASTHVPYYRERGLDGFTTKDQIRESPAAFLSGGYSRWRLISWQTSGTTGKPLTVCYSAQAMQKMWAFLELYRNSAGVSRKQRHAQFTGKAIVPPRQRSNQKTFWRWDLFNRTLLLSSFHLSAENLPYYADALDRYSPVYLSGYPSVIALLAGYYRQAGRPAPRLSAVLTSAETLLEHQRRIIEDTFSVRVFDQYGQTEMQSFWFECEAGRMHAHPLAGVTEILRPDDTPTAPGEMGEVVLTGLVNYAMPLIRYRIRDTARFSTRSCPCGRSMPVIEEIGGRLDDLVFTRERGFLGRLDPVLKGVRHIVESQIEQVSLELLRIRYVPAPDFTFEDLRPLETNLRARVGRGIHLEFECTTCIPRSKGGKARFVISRLNLPRSCASSHV